MQNIYHYPGGKQDDCGMPEFKEPFKATDINPHFSLR